MGQLTYRMNTEEIKDAIELYVKNRFKNLKVVKIDPQISIERQYDCRLDAINVVCEMEPS